VGDIKGLAEAMISTLTEPTDLRALQQRVTFFCRWGFSRIYAGVGCWLMLEFSEIAWLNCLIAFEIYLPILSIKWWVLSTNSNKLIEYKTTTNTRLKLAEDTQSCFAVQFCRSSLN